MLVTMKDMEVAKMEFLKEHGGYDHIEQENHEHCAYTKRYYAKDGKVFWEHTYQPQTNSDTICVECDCADFKSGHRYYA